MDISNIAVAFAPGDEAKIREIPGFHGVELYARLKQLRGDEIGSVDHDGTFLHFYPLKQGE